MALFLTFLSGSLLSAWSVSPVLALGCVDGLVNAQCKNGPPLPGQASVCDMTSEIDAKFISMSGVALNGQCDDVCCVAKNQALCQAVAQALKQTGTFTCAPTCGSGVALTTIKAGETCGAGFVCCGQVVEPGAKQAPKGSPGSPTEITNPLGAGTTLFTIINRIITAFLGVIGALTLGVFVYAGVLYMTAGTSDRVKEAVDTMKYAVIGLAMIAFSYSITKFFLDAFLGTGS